jgi:AAA ATPase domain
MKIRRIKFKNHHVLGNLELNFTDENGKAVDSVIFAGENGCGKTRILDAIYGIKKMLASEADFYILKNHLGINEVEVEFRGDSFNKIDSHIAMFSSEPRSNNYKAKFYPTRIDFSTHSVDIVPMVELDTETTGSELTDEYVRGRVLMGVKRFFEGSYSNSIYFKVGIETEQPDIKGISVEYKISQPVSISGTILKDIQSLLDEILKLDNDTFLDWASKNFDERINEESRYKRLARFKKAFDNFFESKKLDYGMNSDKVSKLSVEFNEFGQTIGIDNLSSGEKRIVYTGAFLLNCSTNENDGIFILIDEPEIGMHPKWQLKILDFYKQLFTDENGVQTSQIFVATHSPFIVHNPNRTNDKTIILKKDEEGKIYVDNDGAFYNYSMEEVSVNAFGLNFGELLKSDKPLLVFEGKTDNMLFETAFRSIYNTDISAKYNLSPSDSGATGAKALNQFLLHHISKLSSQSKIVAIFDFDKEGFSQLKGLKKHFTQIAEDRNCLVFKHNLQQNVYAITLVAPEFREKFIDKENADYCYLSTEMLLKDEHIPEENRYRPSPNEEILFSFCVGKKDSFANKVKTNSENVDFAGFKPTFELIEKLIQLGEN